MAQTVHSDLPSWEGPDDGKRALLRFRFWQLEITTATVFITTWFCSLGPAAAIVALLVAKHMLVSILVVGQANAPVKSGDFHALQGEPAAFEDQE